MTKTKKRRFEADEVEGEYAKPGPRMDRDAARIAAMISDIKKREQTPVVINWRPPWLRGSLAAAAWRAEKQAREAESANRAARAKSPQDDREVQEADMRLALSNDSVRMMGFARRKYQDTPAFGFYFYQDKLAVDLLDRDDGAPAEMDALADDVSAADRQIAAIKTALCAEHGVRYLSLGPDDELDAVQVAAKLGATTFRKGLSPARRRGGGDGFSEEGDTL